MEKDPELAAADLLGPSLKAWSLFLVTEL